MKKKISSNSNGKYICRSVFTILMAGYLPFFPSESVAQELTEILRPGDQVCGAQIPSAFIPLFSGESSTFNLYMPDVGGVKRLSRLSGNGITFANDHALISINSDGTRDCLIQEGAAVPGVPGETFPDNIFTVAFRSISNFVVGSLLNPELPFEQHRKGQWLWDSASAQLQPILIPGSAYPGLDLPGATIRSARIAENGYGNPTNRTANAEILMTVDLEGPGVSDLNNQALIFRQSTGENVVVFRKGQQAPGRPAGVTIYSWYVAGTPEGNNIITARLVQNGTDQGVAVYLVRGATPTLVVAHGQQAPGYAAGTTVIVSYDQRSAFINENGDLLVTVALVGNGHDATLNDTAILVYRNGTLSSLIDNDEILELLGVSAPIVHLHAILMKNSGTSLIGVSLYDSEDLTTANFAGYAVIQVAASGNKTVIAPLNTSLPGLPEYRLGHLSASLSNTRDEQGNAALLGYFYSDSGQARLAVMLAGDSGLETVAYEGQDLLGETVNFIYGSTPNPLIGPRGELTFVVKGTQTTRAIARDASGNMSVILSTSLDRMVMTGQNINLNGETLVGLPQSRQLFKYRFAQSVSPSCPADFNTDGAVNPADITAFLTAWFAHSTSADFDGSGGVSVPDIFAFLNAFYEGCN